MRVEEATCFQLIQLKRDGTKLVLKATINLLNFVEILANILDYENRIIFTKRGLYSLEILENDDGSKQPVIKNIRPYDLEEVKLWISPDYANFEPVSIRDTHTTLLTDYNKEQCLLTNRERTDIQAQIVNLPHFTKNSDKPKSLQILSADGKFLESYNLFDNSRNTVPHYLMFKKSMFSSYDYKT